LPDDRLDAARGQIDRTPAPANDAKTLSEREAAGRLARLGGSEPLLKAPPRRRGHPRADVASRR
jgi:hypothetical protein